jgi:ribosomal 50S subunit-recycling heat shock protein
LSAAQEQRCDVWLFRARLFKSRSGAGRFIDGHRVRVERNGAVARVKKPSNPVRPGDRLVYIRSGKLVRITVLALAERRGPAAEARLLYQLEDVSAEAQ